ncbi:hypothetical protein PTKIN_Ptkin05aG0154200 [Pterospermum kingtungense]
MNDVLLLENKNNSKHHQDPPSIVLRGESNKDSEGDGSELELMDEGAASKEFIHALKGMLGKHKPVILGLLKPRVSGAHADDICKKIGFDNWLRVEAIGFSSGLWVFWKDSVTIEVVQTHPQLIVLKVIHPKPWFLSIIYSSPDYSLRKLLWKDLDQVRLAVDGPWLPVRDYNLVYLANESSSKYIFNQNRNSSFVDWIFDQGLMDLGSVGPKFTWMRGTTTQTFNGARLDKAFCNFSLRELFLEAKVIHLPRVCSNHLPLQVMMDAPSFNSRASSFRFQATWMAHREFFPLVQEVWDNNVSRLKVELTDWNISSFGNIFKKKRSLYWEESRSYLLISKHADI